MCKMCNLVVSVRVHGVLIPLSLHHFHSSCVHFKQSNMRTCSCACVPITLCLIAGRASTSFCSPSCLFPTYTCRSRGIQLIESSTLHPWRRRLYQESLGSVYLKKYSNNSEAIVFSHSLLKQSVLVRVPVD